MGRVRLLTFVLGGVALVAAVALHFAGTGMKAYGAAPGPAMLDLQGWLTTGGGAAMILGWAVQFIPQLNIPSTVKAPVLAVANIARLKACLTENESDPLTSASINAAGRAACDAWRDSLFPPTSK